MPDFEYKDDVLKLMNALVNILAIVKHFQNKIKDWLASQGLSTPTEEQVLEVVRKNYDLTLKLQDSLDLYERYNERPKHVHFFTNMVRDVVIDTRKQVYASIKEVIHTPQQDLICPSATTATTTTATAVAATTPSSSSESTDVTNPTNAVASNNDTTSTPIPLIASV